MTDAARNLSPDELDALTRRLAARVPRDASAMAPSSVVDIVTHRRQPLGLRPVDDGPPERDASTYTGGDLEHGPIVDFDDIAQETLNQPADVGLVYVSLNAAVSASEKSHQKLKTKVAELETEIARLTAQVAIAQAKVGELSFVSERLRIEGKGPPGERGPMGRDGREGAHGERGARGAEGKQGRPAPNIVAWTLDEQAFTATPLLSDGRKGAVLHLMPLFQSYTEQMEASDAAEEHDVVQAQRAVIEREAEARRLGLPR